MVRLNGHHDMVGKQCVKPRAPVVACACALQDEGLARVHLPIGYQKKPHLPTPASGAPVYGIATGRSFLSDDQQ